MLYSSQPFPLAQYEDEFFGAGPQQERYHTAATEFSSYDNTAKNKNKSEFSSSRDTPTPTTTSGSRYNRLLHHSNERSTTSLIERETPLLQATTTPPRRNRVAPARRHGRFHLVPSRHDHARPTQLVETDTEVRLQIDLPGVKAQHVDLFLNRHDGILSLSARREILIPSGKSLQEKKTYRLHKTFAVDHVDSSKPMTAKLIQGVLHVVLQKVQEKDDEPVRINVTTSTNEEEEVEEQENEIGQRETTTTTRSPTTQHHSSSFSTTTSLFSSASSISDDEEEAEDQVLNAEW